MASATAAALSRTSSHSSHGKRVWSIARNELPSKRTAAATGEGDRTVLTGRLSPRPPNDVHPRRRLDAVLDRERGGLRRGRVLDGLAGVLHPEGLLELARLEHL